jgi:hypothetical protein
VWQALYEEINDPNFEIICVAEDTQGEEAAGEFFDVANASYVCIVDPNHMISTLFGFVNVPAAVWIDEEGRIVRHNEGTYASKHTIENKVAGTIKFGTDKYSPAIKDWVAKGADSEFAWSPDEVRAHLKPHTEETALADPNFKMGAYFKSVGNDAKARHYFEEAQRLSPDNWNYHRQDWTYDGEMAAGKRWYKKSQALGEKLYYDKLELPSEK